ncbi:hypothetical protein INR49_020996 [Caranx melampygus]|nr:hypothetical protein INR49_020996 [Caranx melampygus]
MSSSPGTESTPLLRRGMTPARGRRRLLTLLASSTCRSVIHWDHHGDQAWLTVGRKQHTASQPFSAGLSHGLWMNWRNLSSGTRRRHVLQQTLSVSPCDRKVVMHQDEDVCEAQMAQLSDAVHSFTLDQT